MPQDQETPLPAILPRAGAPSIAYHRLEGKSPTVVFLGGFRSDMTGQKALALEGFCRQRGLSFLRFDYTGHGQSGGDFLDGTIETWRRDSLDTIDRLTQGRLVLVGSSMGGWMMLLAALARPERVAGLVGIAAAPDFTEELMWPNMAEPVRRALQEKGVIYRPTAYSNDPYPITLGLIETGRKHCLLDKPIPLSCPARLIHGMKDPDVPWQTAARLAERLAATDVVVTLIKEGGHRLSEPAEIARIEAAVAELVAKVSP